MLALIKEHKADDKDTHQQKQNGTDYDEYEIFLRLKHKKDTARQEYKIKLAILDITIHNSK
ncbi:hypothetical protein GCM10023313_37850 [Mucilaginibacter defluvii]|uniref:Uncharacterized protein n=1 Tax=Mucilaginibacter defluvii TaxID=1196019 RepID=A0ABP9G7D5_9SPHI